MRTVTYGAACSLDGFIAAADGSIDWLHFSKDVHQVMAKYWATIDTVVMGRKTWTATPESTADAGSGAGMAGITTYIFSRTLKSVSAPRTHLIASDAGEFVRELKRQPGKGICVMGGGELAQSLLAAGVVDEVGLNIHPIILGAGIPFFRDPGRRIALTLAESRPLDGGCILVTYRVDSSGSPRATRGG